MDIIIVCCTSLENTGVLTCDFLDQVGVNVDGSIHHGVVFKRDNDAWEIYFSNADGSLKVEITFLVGWEETFLHELSQTLGIESIAFLIDPAARSFPDRLLDAGATVETHYYQGPLSTG